MRLVPNRFKSHSHGARIVSSKSLISKTSRPSVPANAPRFRTCASPQICTVIPLDRIVPRSAAITGTFPRKYPNGEAAIRAILIGTSEAIRSRFTARIISTGSCFRSFASHCAWSERFSFDRCCRPNSIRSRVPKLGRIIFHLPRFPTIKQTRLPDNKLCHPERSRGTCCPPVAPTLSPRTPPTLYSTRFRTENKPWPFTTGDPLCKTQGRYRLTNHPAGSVLDAENSLWSGDESGWVYRRPQRRSRLDCHGPGS